MFERIREIATATPDDRERHVDAVRALAIALVVVGHWIVVAVTEDADGLDGVNALAVVDWFAPLTWVFQVMPLFFFVGGYANAASLASHLRRGGDAWAWVAQRFDRLVRPTAALLAVVVVAAFGAGVLGVSSDELSRAVWLVTVPLWFVVAYLAVCALAPAMWRLHRRARAWVPVTLVGAVAVAELVGLGAGPGAIRYANFVLVFVAFHQLGMMWRDGALAATVGTGLRLAVPAGGAAIVAVALGPYPVAMVDVPGYDLQNASPPSIAFLLLGLAQIGGVLAVRDVAVGWLRRPAPWGVVVAVNAVVLTLFLWHMTAALLAALVLHVVAPVPIHAIGSVEWLALRVPWLGACLVVLLALVAAFSPVERAASGGSPARIGRTSARIALVAAVAIVVAGMLGIAVAGPSDPARLGIPAWAIVAFALGAALIVAIARRVDRPLRSGGGTP